MEISGGSIFSGIVFYASVVVSGGFLLSVIFTVVYHRFLYPVFYRPRYDESYKPSSLVVLPCKGQPDNFRENLVSFFKQDYPDYSVVFALESREDSAFPVVEEVLEEYGRDRDSFVIAGKTESGCQKNRNLIAAVDEFGRDHEVFVFADSDISINNKWLSELVLPLSDERICVATGFRWLYSVNRNIGEIINSYQNALLMSLFTVSSFIRNIGLWGGSMALRQRDFKELGVREYWSKTVVDDISLSKLVVKGKRKSVMVSTCVTDTGDALQTLSKSLHWFTRQVMFLKAYYRWEWYQGIGLSFLIFLFLLLLPVALTGSVLTEMSFADIGGWSSVVFLGGVYISGLFFPLIGSRCVSFKFLLVQPLCMFLVGVSVFKTLFNRSVLWSGYRYHIDRSGIVVSIEEGD
ncbi:MAG: glycosyltransferase [Chitinivibrionales bacterium]